MARTDNDTWDPATSVGTTATLVATARALANRAGLINDPFAEPLVRAVGTDFFTQVASGERAISDLGDDNGFALLTDLFAVRTRFFDNFLTDAGRACPLAPTKSATASAAAPISQIAFRFFMGK